MVSFFFFIIKDSMSINNLVYICSYDSFKRIAFVLFFFFYTYFYFTVDEEFMVFIVIFIWLVFFISYYLKNLYLFFQDNAKNILKEYYFFHNRRNFFLAVVKDQYYGFISLNKFFNMFLTNLLKNINRNINRKISNYHKRELLVLGERFNFCKLMVKYVLISYRLHFFNLFYKLVFNLVYINQRFLNFFYKPLFNIKKEIDFVKTANIPEDLSLRYIFYYKNTCNLKHKIFFDKNFILNQLIILKLGKLKNKKTSNNKRIIKTFKVLKLVSLLKRTLFFKNLRASKG
jgi:hypothetical protein